MDPLHLWVAACAWRSPSPVQYQGHHQGDDEAGDEASDDACDDACDDAFDDACDDACDDEASSVEPTPIMLIWTFKFEWSW